MRSLAPFLPAALAVVFAAWCGTFGGGATWLAAALGWALLLAPAAWAAGEWSDPWRLGRGGRLLVWALLVAVVVSWRASPVARAGTVGVALLPAFLWLPAVLARAWESEAWRRRGLRAVSIGVAAVAGAALVLWLAGTTPRPALPVGQHLHLIAWLALLLPLALLPWRDGGGWRWLAGASGVLAVAAILAARALAGGLAIALEGALALAWYGAFRRGTRRGRRRAVALGVLSAVVAASVLAVLWSDLAALARGTDSSWDARRVYWSAGWQGLSERPALGFGPGSTAWTLGAFLRPVPGVNPPSEVVGELHMLPLGLGYELGLPALLLAAGATALFAWRRLRERAGACDPGLVAAGLLGLAGGAATGLATAELRVVALPVAASLAAAAALAGGRTAPPEEGAGRAEARARRRGVLVVAVYALAAVATFAPLAVAHRAYDRAIEAPRHEALRHLDRSVRFDPRFPLYRARRGWLAAEAGGDAGDSIEAARGAPGVGALWLAAGAALEAAGEVAAAALAYERACALDPLGALPPFRLARLGSPLHEPASVSARALAAEPRLAAATWWRGHEALLRESVRHLATTAGLDQGWRAALVEGVEALLDAEPPRQTAGATSPAPLTGELGLVFDGTPADSASLHLFRRRPWRARLAPEPIAAEAAATLEHLPPAVSLAGTDPLLFPPTCTGSFVPQRLRRTLWKSW